MANVYLHVLLLLVMLIVTSESRECSVMSETVSASLREDAVLPCSNPRMMNPKSCFRVKWTKQSRDTRRMKVILFRPKTPQFHDSKQVKWEADENGQMSLLVMKLRVSDEGLYRCEIWEGWDCVLVKNISLKVKDCKTLTERAAPGTTANLRCPMDNMASESQQARNISWAKLKGGKLVSLPANRDEINGASVSIQSVNISDSGWYRCMYTFGHDQACFDINLLVQVENVATTVSATAADAKRAMTGSVSVAKRKEEGGSGGGLYTAVASVIFVVAVVAALIGLLAYRRCSSPADTPTQTGVIYEVVNLEVSEDSRNLGVNSPYQQAWDESISTFKR